MEISIESGHHDFLNFANVQISEGVTHGSHPFRLMVVATHHCFTELRTVVLRNFLYETRSLFFHTDIRSPKLSQLEEDPRCSLLFYSKSLTLQLRFRCLVQMYHQDHLTKKIFASLTENQRRCYSIPFSPSSVIKNQDDLKDLRFANHPFNDTYAEKNFAVCECNFFELDLLYLNHEYHRRILYKWDAEGVLESQELIP